MDRKLILQQLLTGRIDQDTLSQYVKNERPDLLPFVEQWQLSKATEDSSEDMRSKKTVRSAPDYDYDEDDIYDDYYEDNFELSRDVLKKLDAIQKELREMRALLRRQENVNAEIAQALESIANVMDAVFGNTELDESQDDGGREPMQELRSEQRKRRKRQSADN